MSILKTVKDLIDPSDPELVEKTLARIAEQDIWNDVFSTKLIDVLDNVDGLKSELRKRMRSVEQSGIEAKQSLEQSASHLARACSVEEKATRDLQSTRQNLLASQQNLNAAQELATVAQGKHVAAAEIFQKTVRWAVTAVALSWIVLVWTAWASFRSVAPIWTPCIATTVIMLAVALLTTGARHEA
ncbi:MAG: hypothetical protein WBN22_04165 [Verrucomicrobiia bacterium]